MKIIKQRKIMNYNFIIEKKDENKRLDVFLEENLTDVTRSYISNMNKKGNILVNGKMTKNGYKLVENDKIDLERYRQANLINPIDYAAALVNPGLCFGMSASSMLFYKGDLREEKYDNSVSFPIEFKPPNTESYNDTLLREMIELLQVSQLRNYDVKELQVPVFKNGELVKEFFWKPSDIAKELDKDNPVMLLLRDGFNGHAVVIYDYYIENGFYYFSIYDCSKFIDCFFIDEEKENGGFIYNEREGSTEFSWGIYGGGVIYYDEIINQVNKMRNSNSNNAISLLSMDKEPTYTYFVRTAENMTITNSIGQTSTIIEGELTGDIEKIDLILDSYLVENPRITVIAPTDTYTITGTSDKEVTTILSDDYMSVEITHKSSTPVTISSDLHEIKIANSTTSDYSVKYTTYDNIFDEMTISGTASGDLTLALDETNVNVTGADSITATATVSGSETTATVDDTSGNDAVIECLEVNGAASE